MIELNWSVIEEVKFLASNNDKDSSTLGDYRTYPMPDATYQFRHPQHITIFLFFPFIIYYSLRLYKVLFLRYTLYTFLNNYQHTKS